MKKYTINLIIALLITLTFQSCLKDYNCDCTVTVSIPGFISSTENVVTTIPKTTKKNAKSACEDAEKQLKEQVSSDGTASCSLK